MFLSKELEIHPKLPVDPKYPDRYECNILPTSRWSGLMKAL